MACAGSRTAQPPSVVSVPVPSSLPDTKAPALSMDQVFPADTVRFIDDPVRAVQEAQRQYDIAVTAADQEDTETVQTAIDEALELLVAIADVQQTEVVIARDDLLKKLSGFVIDLQEGRSPASPGIKGHIPRVMNAGVRKQIKWWTLYNPGVLQASYARSGLYMDTIHQELAKRGLPPELRWLPITESNFKSRAYSWADAAGLWQFILGTGQHYGLQRTGWVDDRMDSHKATGAALDYLSDLYDMFGDWLLAVAAYNCGETRVLRAIRRQGTSDFWKLKLPRETRRYVPRFLATVYIIENPEQYGVTLPDVEPAYAFEECPVDKSITLVDAAGVLGMSADRLKALNTAIRYGVTPPTGYRLRVPLGLGASLLARLDEIPETQFTPPPETQKYRVRRGDTLSGIAVRYRTSVRKLKSMNRLRSDRIRIGQVLEVPGKRYSATAFTVSKKSTSTGSRQTVALNNTKSVPDDMQNVHVHKVRRGNTLSGLARKYSTTVAALKKINGLRGDRLSIGQILRIPGRAVESPPTVVAHGKIGSTVALDATAQSAASYTIRRGDTLLGIAKRFGVTLTALYRANPSTHAQRLKIGQTLKIPGIQDLTGITETHVVKRGDSIWSIARRYGLTVAHVLKLNGLQRGDIIKPGQRLRITTKQNQAVGLR